MPLRTPSSFLTFILAFLSFFMALICPLQARAGDVEFEASEIKIADWNVSGDGKTPTFLQLLDVRGVDAKEASHLISATSKGDAIYSYPLDLPPALLQPSLTLIYSSEASLGPYECVDECSRDCDDVDTRQKYVSATDEKIHSAEQLERPRVTEALST
jgi:hypothetical protein